MSSAPGGGLLGEAALSRRRGTRDGWWSSWTEEHVVSMIDLWSVPPDAELVVEVEGWEESFQIELLRW